jgi:hypothetical protein
MPDATVSALAAYGRARMGPDDVTASWISGVLGGEVGTIHTSRIGDGLVGLNLRIVLDERADGLPPSVVVKLPSLDATSRATGIALRNYEREVRFYTELASTLDVRVPHCYLGDWDASTGDFVLVLEDMAPAEQGDQLTGCSLDQAYDAVRELARLHGPRWDDPTLHDVDWLGRHTGPDDTAQLVGMWQVLFPGFMATYATYLDPDAVALVEWFGGRLGAWVEGRSGPMTVTHGDYRLDNLLFASGEDAGEDAGEYAGGVPSVTVVDWQSPGHGRAAGDLSYFCGAGLLSPIRATHERGLVAAYTDALGAYGVEVDEAWLWEQYRRESFAGVIMAVIASQIVGSSGRSEAMFAAMATRHLRHALDLDARSLV